ncbi:MAG: CopG family transcriptional regulator [Verrucomicrobiota bacterium]
MRTIVDLPEDQLDALAHLCKEQGISRAEAIRRAVRSMLAEEVDSSRIQAFGAWKRKEDSRLIVEKIREEWDR